MTVDLTSARAKMARGRELATALRSEIAAFVDSPNHGLTFESDPSFRQHVAFIHYDPKPAEQRWGLMLGDCVHNYRSALDHAIYQAAQIESGDDLPPHARRLMFIVTPTPVEYTKTRSRIASLSRNVQDVVAALQPHDPSGSGDIPPLLWLNELDNIDKHRLIYTGVVSVDANPWDISPGFDWLTPDASPKASTVARSGMGDGGVWAIVNTDRPTHQFAIVRTAPLFVALLAGRTDQPMQKTPITTVLDAIDFAAERAVAAIEAAVVPASPPTG